MDYRVSHVFCLRSYWVTHQPRARFQGAFPWERWEICQPGHQVGISVRISLHATHSNVLAIWFFFLMFFRSLCPRFLLQPEPGIGSNAPHTLPNLGPDHYLWKRLHLRQSRNHGKVTTSSCNRSVRRRPCGKMSVKSLFTTWHKYGTLPQVPSMLQWLCLVSLILVFDPQNFFAERNLLQFTVRPSHPLRW